MNPRLTNPEEHERRCKTCGEILVRRRETTGALEARTAFRVRQFCSRHCAHGKKAVEAPALDAKIDRVLSAWIDGDFVAFASTPTLKAWREKMKRAIASGFPEILGSDGAR